MSKRSLSSSLFLRSAPLCMAAALTGALGCSSDAGGQLPGSSGTSAGGNPGASAGTNSMTNGGMPVIPSGGSPTTAGTTTGGSPSAGTSTGGSGGSGGSPASGGSGGSTAGGSGGSSGSGGGSGGGGSTDCKSFKLCDDFEGDAPGKGTSPWKVTGTAEVVTDVFHGGTHSVHFKIASGGGVNNNINESKTFPMADSWGRAWVQIKSTGSEHQMYIGMNFSGNQDRLLNRLGSDTAQVNFQVGDKFYGAPDKFVQGTWFCYEWHVTTAATSIYIGGKKQMLTNGTNGDAPGVTGGTSLLLGMQRFVNGTVAGDVWYDDVAVNDTQIGGCQ